LLDIEIHGFVASAGGKSVQQTANQLHLEISH